MAAFEAWLVFFILVVNVVGELQRKSTLAASRGFLAAARLSCLNSFNVGIRKKWLITTMKNFHSSLTLLLHYLVKLTLV